ncbi:hypothetical protein FRB90_003762 [Tulasnella sp. 427]|nr:hypothetical protein FRB90_003762 [Tulasnella sp. 427]
MPPSALRSPLLVPSPLVPRAPLAARLLQQQYQYAPLSASQAFRSSQNPRNAVLQAFASSNSDSDRCNAMEGSPTPTSTPRIGSVLAVRSFPKRAQSAITPPFGMRHPTSGLGRMMPGPAWCGSFESGVQCWCRQSRSLSVPLSPPATSGADVGDPLFLSVDVEQSQQIMKEGSFGQIAGSPEAAPNPWAPPPPALDHPDNDAGDEESSDEDELILSASRRNGRFAPRPVRSGRMEEPRRDVAEDRLGDAAGSFPTGEDATRKKTLEFLSLLGSQEAGRGKLNRRRSRRRAGESKGADTFRYYDYHYGKQKDNESTRESEREQVHRINAELDSTHGRRRTPRGPSVIQVLCDAVRDRWWCEARVA